MAQNFTTLKSCASRSVILQIVVIFFDSGSFILNWFFEHWRDLFRSILGSFAAIFLPIEAFEVLDLGNLSHSAPQFLAIVLIPGLLVFVVDGLFC